jgi:hypothetical protein
MNKEKALSILTTVGKVLGFITGLGAIPLVPPQTGILIFDNGKKDDSFNT